MSDHLNLFWQAFEDRKGPCILSTTGEDNAPNSIYVGVLKREADCIVIVDSAFHKTRANLQNNPKVSFLFMSEQGVAYQVKGSVDYRNDDDSLADALSWAPPMYEPKALVSITIEQIYTGAICIYPEPS